MAVRCEWDENKNRANIAKHGVSFAEVVVFEDPLSLTVPDRVTDGERRYRKAWFWLLTRCTRYLDRMSGFASFRLDTQRQERGRRMKKTTSKTRNTKARRVAPKPDSQIDTSDIPDPRLDRRGARIVRPNSNAAD
jgi:hypothetical protein